MIFAALNQTILTIDTEIKAKQKEKEALLQIGEELNPFLEKIKALCAKVPRHQEQIFNIIIGELGIKTTGTKAKKTSTAKEPPFKVGDKLRVSKGVNIGHTFQVEKIKARGLGWQVWDSEGNIYASSSVGYRFSATNNPTTEEATATTSSETTETETTEELEQEVSWPIPKGTIVRRQSGEDTKSEGEIIEYDPKENRVRVQWPNNRTWWDPSGLVLVEPEPKPEPEETMATEELEPKPEPKETTDSDVSDIAAEEPENLIEKAIAALNNSPEMPKHLKSRENETLAGNKNIAIIGDSDRTRGYITIIDGEFKIGSELAEEPYLESIKSALKPIAPIWEKKPEAPMKDGINLGRGIKKDFRSLSHEDLMIGKLPIDNYSKDEWIEWATLAGIEAPKGTKKQIALQTCKIYQDAYNNSQTEKAKASS